MKVSDVMTRGVISVTPSMRLRDVARLLSEHQVSGVPVVDDDGRIIGVLSEGDLLAKQLSHPVSRRMPLEWILGEHHDTDELRRRAATTAGEAMTSPALTIEADRPIREAAARMIERHVNRLPVVAAGRLVGIVTRADLVRAYLRLDDEVRHAITEDVIRRTMWLDPSRFEIDVDEGIVAIAGTVDRRSTARILAKLIGLVDGVAGLHDQLRWEFDDSGIAPGGETEREPGAASVTAREHPPALHR
jgi:CBS domain-containing protein